MSDKFRSGFVALIGRPNVGKSTLMNHLTGEKIAIISKKPQTTRNKIQGILTRDNFQIVFLDTPGLHKPKHKLGRAMVKTAEGAIKEVDTALFLTEPLKRLPDTDKDIIEKFKDLTIPVFLVINKIDTVGKKDLLKIIDEYSKLYPFAGIIPLSALKGENTDVLIDEIYKKLPFGPKYFPDDMVTDQPERQIVAEIIREKALELLQEEIPHGVLIEIESMKKRPNADLVDVGAVIFCEKESHKGIIIGKEGLMLKRIGQRARRDIENLLGSPVYIELWVKVKKNWRDNAFMLKNFGY